MNVNLYATKHEAEEAAVRTQRKYTRPQYFKVAPVKAWRVVRSARGKREFAAALSRVPCIDK